MAAAATQSEVTQPLLPEAEPAASNAHAQSDARQAEQRPRGEEAAALPSQTGTLRVLGLVLVVVALLVAGAALLSRSGVVYSDSPPPQCRKSAALAVLRQAEFSANTLQAADTGILHLLIWGGRGKKSDTVLTDLHVMNLQDRKWHAVKQKAGHVSADSTYDMLGMRNIADSAPGQHAFGATASQLPEARWKQLSATDAGSNTMVMFGGDGLYDPDDDQDDLDNSPNCLDNSDDDPDSSFNDHDQNLTSGNGHNYFNDAWTVGLYNSKARWQELWNTDAEGSAPVPRRAAAGALYSSPNSTNDVLYIHGGRHQAGHLLNDLWEATLGAGNITYTQRVPRKKLGAKGSQPKARKGHCAVVVHDSPDPSLVIFGGRNNFGYFNDVWAWKMNTHTWEQWSKSDETAPIGRDHFGAVYDAGQMYIFGGRGGSSYGDSKPLDDLWRFSIADRTWTQLNATGPAPLPRFLFSYDLFYPVLHQSQASAPTAVALQQPGVTSAEELDSTAASTAVHSSSDRSLGELVGRAAAEVASAEKLDSTAAASAGHSNLNLNSSLVQSQGRAAAGEAGLKQDTSTKAGAENTGPAGAMVVFGGESVQGCYLNDVWVLHLNSLLWQQLSKPIACQKRCRELLEGH